MTKMRVSPYAPNYTEFGFRYNDTTMMYEVHWDRKQLVIEMPLSLKTVRFTKGEAKKLAVAVNQFILGSPLKQR